VETKTIAVKARDDSGKGVARKLRASGMVPAVLYGPETKPLPLAVNKRELLAIFRSSASDNILLDLQVEGQQEKPYTVLLKDVQYEPVDGSLLHVDFQQVSLTKKINVEIPIKLTGTPEGVKTMGGILEFIQRRLSVACLPTEIMESVEIDVTELNVGDAVHAKDIDLKGIELLTNPNQVVATVVAPTVSKVSETEAEGEGEEGAEEGEGAAEGEAEGGEEAAEPEVITEKKKE